ncbi:MAG: hypothetical protein ACLFVL_06855 [Candidatus Aenigmatarchaeota archaeon]
MRFGRRGPRKASNIQRKNLIENAKKLAKDPLKVIPECQDNCLLCKFGRAKRKIKKISKYSDDKKKLKKYAKRGPDLSRAVAATILFGMEKEADLLTTAMTPQGEIAFAKKGKASKKRLIGVQHFDDPKKRLIAYSPESEKGFHFYSVGDKVVCTGKDPKPPKRYVKEAIKRIPYALSKQDSNYHCGHVGKKGKEGKGYLTLNWKNVGRKFSICEDCAKDDVNLFVVLTERKLSDDNSKPFSIEGKWKMRCEGDCESCRLDERVPVPEDMREDYFKGLSDRDFLKRYSDKSRSVFKDRGNLFIKGEVCYGRDIKAFLAQLDFKDWEKPAVVSLMKKTGGVVLEEGTVNELFEEYWEGHEKEVLSSILDDEKVIKEILDKDLRPREVLRELRKEKKKKEELEALPEFKRLPPEGEFTDNIARVYKVQGKEEAINEMENQSLSNKRIKSIAYGFYLAFGKGDSKRWKYEQAEVESGEFLAEYIEKLLDSTGREYAEKLQDVVKMSGSTAAVVLKSGEKMR